MTFGEHAVGMIVWWNMLSSPRLVLSALSVLDHLFIRRILFGVRLLTWFDVHFDALLQSRTPFTLPARRSLIESAFAWIGK